MTSEEITHLELVSIFHYVVGGVLALFSCFPFVHMAVGVFIIVGGFPDSEEPIDGFAQVFGARFVFMADMFITRWMVDFDRYVDGGPLNLRIHRQCQHLQFE